MSQMVNESVSHESRVNETHSQYSNNLLIKARFTLQKIFGTARVKLTRVPKKKVRLG